ASVQLRPVYMISSSYLWLRRPLSSTLFPYTTLFRSCMGPTNRTYVSPWSSSSSTASCREQVSRYSTRRSWWWETCSLQDAVELRSEEHTSELQSRENLVCRLLLEKKKDKE